MLAVLRRPARLIQQLREWFVPITATVLLGGVFVLDSLQSYHSAQEQAQMALNFHSRASAWALRTTLTRADMLLQTIAANITRLGEKGPAPGSEAITSELQRHYQNLPRRPDLYYADREGVVVASTNRDLIGTQITNAENFSRQRLQSPATATMHFGRGFAGASDEKKLELSRAVFDMQGRFIGSVALIGDRAIVRDVIETTLPVGNEVTTVLDESGAVIVQAQRQAASASSNRQGDHGSWADQADFKAYLRSGASHSLAPALDSTKRSLWIAYRDVESYPLIVATSITDADTRHAWIRANLIRWGVLSGALLLLFWFGWNNLRRQRAIAIAHNRFATLIENAEDVIAIVNEAGFVTWASSSLARITGYRPKDVIGTHYLQTVHREDRPTLELALHRLRTNPGERITLYCHIHSKQRGWIPVEGTASAHFNTPGIGGAIIIYHDVSERESHTLALTQSEQMLNQAQNLAALGSWRYDPATRHFQLSDEASRILGICGTRTISRRKMLSFIHPVDRAAVADTWRGTVQGDDYDMGHRIIVGHETRWVHARASIYTDDFGKIRGAVGTLQDVTAQHLAAMQLSELLEFNQAIIDSSTVGIAVMSPQGHCVMANSAIARIVGTQAENIMRLNFREMPVWRDNGALAAAEATLATGEPHVVRYTGLGTFGSPLAVEFKFSSIQHHGERHLLLLLTDISEFDASARAMTEARKLAEEANRAKSEFLANMSHEIRTPLNAVIGLTQLSLDRTADATLREYLMQMGQSANSLLEIINDILDYSKIEAGRLTLESHEFSLRDITARVLGMFRQAAGAKGVALTTEIADNVPPRVVGDPTRITQIVVNLVANAVKFTEAGHVTLCIQRRTTSTDDPRKSLGDLPPNDAAPAEVLGEIDFVVTDTGIGMSEQAVAGLFRPFTQADGSTTRRYGGTGLGLTISRRLTDLMNGRIAVTSALGKGSCFTLTLPLKFSTGPTRHTTHPDATASNRPNEMAVRAQPIVGCHILLVEDDRVNQMVIERLLLRAGLRVAIARNGQEALEQLNAAENGSPDACFDAVLMDLQMPVMDGFAATRAIRADSRWPLLPVIAVTAAVLTHDEAACREVGMTGYLHKPVQPLALIDMLVSQIAPQHVSRGASTQTQEVAARKPAPLPPDVLRERLIALQSRMLAHEFIAVTELSEIRTLLSTLSDARAERLEGAISRYDYAQAQVIMADLIASLSAADATVHLQAPS